jgi:hypothetical protein
MISEIFASWGSYKLVPAWVFDHGEFFLRDLLLQPLFMVALFSRLVFTDLVFPFHFFLAPHFLFLSSYYL